MTSLVLLAAASLALPSVSFTAPVTSVTPDIGPEAGGTIVTIGGSLFTGATEVDFGKNPCVDQNGQPTFIVNSDTSITATSPPGTGTVTVSVKK